VSQIARAPAPIPLPTQYDSTYVGHRVAARLLRPGGALPATGPDLAPFRTGTPVARWRSPEPDGLGMLAALILKKRDEWGSGSTGPSPRSRRPRSCSPACAATVRCTPAAGIGKIAETQGLREGGHGGALAGLDASVHVPRSRAVVATGRKPPVVTHVTGGPGRGRTGDERIVEAAEANPANGAAMRTAVGPTLQACVCIF
jgi:hypothetical protein